MSKAKKPAAEKPKAEKAKDQHKSGFMVRLPESYRPLLARAKKEHGQIFTVAVVRALNAYLPTLGIDPPAN